MPKEAQRRNANTPPRRRVQGRTQPQRSGRRRAHIGLVLGGVAGLVAIAALAVAATGFLGSSGGLPAGETIVRANGGQWTDVTADRLASMLDAKDFTLLNVKTPYIGEIAGTDLYIPYDQLTARAAQLPGSKAAKIVVYCRTGHESSIAAQTLLDLGYTNIYTLAGGMEAWTSSGRAIVNLNRRTS